MFVTIVTDCPKLKHLLRYKNKIASDWHDLGVQLLDDESYHELNTIKENYPKNINECCSRMFQLWLRKSKQPSWKKLIRALKNIGMDNLAHAIESLWGM